MKKQIPQFYIYKIITRLIRKEICLTALFLSSHFSSRSDNGTRRHDGFDDTADVARVDAVEAQDPHLSLVVQELVAVNRPQNITEPGTHHHQRPVLRAARMLTAAVAQEIVCLAVQESIGIELHGFGPKFRVMMKRPDINSNAAL